MLRAVALVIVIVVAACGPATIPIEQLNAQLDQAECARRVRCGISDSVEACLAQPRAPFDLWPARTTPSIIGAVAAGVITYDDVQAAECVDEVASQSCVLADLSVRVQPSAICLGVFRSDRKISEPCMFDAECSTRRCAPLSECAPGTCCAGTCGEPEHLVRVGDDCTSYPCAPNAYCAGSTCRALLPRGAFCYQNGSCAFGLDCLDTCKDPPSEGDPCGDLNGQPSCGSRLGLVCDVPTMTCRTPYLAVGATCQPGSSLCKDSMCGTGLHVCVATPRIGETCTGTCAAGAFCAYGGDGHRLCLPLVDTGSRCFGDPRACRSGLCDADDICIDAPVCL